MFESELGIDEEGRKESAVMKPFPERPKQTEGGAGEIRE